MTITLIGMPAAGKSCMGRMLSKKLKMKTIDGDKLIEQITGKKLQQLIDENGLDGFKRIEEEALLSIEEDDIIFTPGGSAVYYPAVMNRFKEKGIIVYLYASPDIIEKRPVDFSSRGLVLKEGQTIRDLYNERAPLFEKYADITVNCNGNAFQKYQKDALEKISKYLNANVNAEQNTK